MIIFKNALAQKYAALLLVYLKDGNPYQDFVNKVSYLIAKIGNNNLEKNFLFNKNVPKKEKMIFCKGIFLDKNVPNVLKNFVKILINNNTFYLIEAIAYNLQRILDEQNNTKIINLTFANKMPNDQLAIIKNELEQYFYHKYDNRVKNIKFSIDFNKSILGGLIIRDGSFMMDLSLSSKVKRICRLNRTIDLKNTFYR